MKLNIPEVQEAADEMAALRVQGVRVVHYVPPSVVDALTLVSLGLLALALALVYATEGSGVAAKRGGRRG